MPASEEASKQMAETPSIAVTMLTSVSRAIELIETDLWQQYNELGGVDGGNPAYMAALSNLDSDMP